MNITTCLLKNKTRTNPEAFPSPSFCRISEFGSINRREFVTPIVAKRQNIASKTNVSKLRITCFSAVGISNSRFFPQPNSCVPLVASEQSSSGKFGETNPLRREGKLIKTENVTSNKIIKE